MTDIVLILTTAPQGDQGEAIARTLVDERLAACVNVLSPMTSWYRWRGVVERAAESQIVIKTSRDRVPAVRARLAELHSYELPELIVIDIIDGSPQYLEWVKGETR
jgi:periplasmic divalent cation tolerance protein